MGFICQLILLLFFIIHFMYVNLDFNPDPGVYHCFISLGGEDVIKCAGF